VAPKAAVYTYSLSKGLFAGGSLEGAVIVTEKGKNERYYGRSVTASQILSGMRPPGRGAPFCGRPPALRRLFLYKSIRISQAETVRPSLLVLAFLTLATASYAQEQERKLVDRLLSPNTKLANPDQNKKFVGGVETPTRSAATKSFYVSEKSLSKTFVADRSAPTTSFRTRNYSTQAAVVPTSPPTRTYQTKQARDISPNAYSTKKYAARDFGGNRPFLGQGKSQKALHAQDRPLTIDEVRELLNKNK